MHAFKTAVEARDHDAIYALLDEHVVFKSPAVFKPYQGRDTVAMILGLVINVFEDFTYVKEIGADGAADSVLVFTAHVGDKQLEGADFLHANEQGLIDEFTVMIRPRSGLLALADKMNEAFTKATSGS
jgi:hypothetical protein